MLCLSYTLDLHCNQAIIPVFAFIVRPAAAHPIMAKTDQAIEQSVGSGPASHASSQLASQPAVFCVLYPKQVFQVQFFQHERQCLSSIVSPNPANVVPHQLAKHCSHLNLVPGSKTSFADQVPCSMNAFEMQLSCYVFHHGQSRVDHIAHSLISSISRQCQPTTASFVSADNHGLCTPSPLFSPPPDVP